MPDHSESHLTPEESSVRSDPYRGSRQGGETPGCRQGSDSGSATARLRHEVGVAAYHEGRAPVEALVPPFDGLLELGLAAGEPDVDLVGVLALRGRVLLVLVTAPQSSPNIILHPILNPTLSLKSNASQIIPGERRTLSKENPLHTLQQ